VVLSPSIWLVASSLVDLLIASTLAIGGIAMTPYLFGVAGVLAALRSSHYLGLCEVPIFARLKDRVAREALPKG